MTVFVDASAMVSMIAGESDAADLANLLEADPLRLCSAMSAWETVAGLCRSHAFSVGSAPAQVRSFLETIAVSFVAIGEREFDIAADAYARFGKGRHPAALNMGDCFAYACAKGNRAKLLFKGDDFSRTDIEPAGP